MRAATLLFYLFTTVAVAQPNTTVKQPSKVTVLSAAEQQSSAKNAPPSKLVATEDLPVSVTIVRSASEAASAAERDKQNDERDAKSLVIQERSAAATEEQALIAKWSIMVSVVGTVLLLWNIAQTRKATISAADAAEAATEQVRAVISMERASLIVIDVSLRVVRTGLEGEKLYLPVVTYINHGRSAAMVTKAGIKVKVCAESDLKPFPEYQETVDCDPSSIGSLFLKPGETFTDQPLGMLSVSQEQHATLGKDGQFIWVWGHIEYIDQFDGLTDAGFIAFQYPEIKAGERLIQPASFRFKGPAAYTYIKHGPGKRSQSV